MLDILAHHPATIRRISTRLCAWFLGYNPPQTVVDAVVQRATATNLNIKEMIRAIFADKTTVRAQNLKLKRPLEFMESGIRAVGGDVTSASRVASVAGQAGEVPFEWSPPNGYPDALGYWGQLLLPRWNAAFWLMSNGLGTKVTIADLLDGAASIDAIADRIDLILYGGEMPKADKDIVKVFLGGDKTPTKLAAEAFGLAMALPGFQWY